LGGLIVPGTNGKGDPSNGQRPVGLQIAVGEAEAVVRVAVETTSHRRLGKGADGLALVEGYCDNGGKACPQALSRVHPELKSPFEEDKLTATVFETGPKCNKSTSAKLLTRQIRN
jgi:hypothetical protein